MMYDINKIERDKRRNSIAFLIMMLLGSIILTISLSDFYSSFCCIHKIFYKYIFSSIIMQSIGLMFLSLKLNFYNIFLYLTIKATYFLSILFMLFYCINQLDYLNLWVRVLIMILGGTVFFTFYRKTYLPANDIMDKYEKALSIYTEWNNVFKLLKFEKNVIVVIILLEKMIKLAQEDKKLKIFVISNKMKDELISYIDDFFTKKA